MMLIIIYHQLLFYKETTLFPDFGSSIKMINSDYTYIIKIIIVATFIQIIIFLRWH